MIRLIVITIFCICLFRNATAQWSETTLHGSEKQKIIFSSFSEISLSQSGNLYVFDKQFNRLSTYFLSKDHGKTWQPKTTWHLILAASADEYCWGYNSIEEDDIGNPLLVIKRKPCPINNNISYLTYNCSSEDDIWNNKKTLTTNEGIRWSSTPTQNTFTGNFHFLYSQRIDNTNSVAIGIDISRKPNKLVIYFSSNRGKTWMSNIVNVSGGITLINKFLGIRFFNRSTGIIFLESEYLTTSDGGYTWQSMTYPQDFIPVSCDAYDINNILIATDNSVFRYAKNVDFVTQLYEGIDNDRIVKIKLTNNQINILTEKGLFIKEMNPQNVSTPVIDLQPTIYPNPVNDVLNISFVLDKDSKVKFSIENVIGQTIYNLQVGNYFKGSNTQTLSTFDLVPGIYVVNIFTDSGTSHARFIKK